MLELSGILEAGDFIYTIALCFAFFMGIMLIVSREAVECLNKDFQREYGWKRYVLSQLEEPKYKFIDAVVMKYPLWVGLLVSITSFLLLLIHHCCPK